MLVLETSALTDYAIGALVKELVVNSHRSQQSLLYACLMFCQHFLVDKGQKK